MHKKHIFPNMTKYMGRKEYNISFQLIKKKPINLQIAILCSPNIHLQQSPLCPPKYLGGYLISLLVGCACHLKKWKGICTHLPFVFDSEI